MVYLHRRIILRRRNTYEKNVFSLGFSFDDAFTRLR